MTRLPAASPAIPKRRRPRLFLAATHARRAGGGRVYAKAGRRRALDACGCRGRAHAKLIEGLASVEEGYAGYDPRLRGRRRSGGHTGPTQIRAIRRARPDDLEPVTRQAAEHGARSRSEYISAVKPSTARGAARRLLRRHESCCRRRRPVSLPLGAVRMAVQRAISAGPAPMVALICVQRSRSSAMSCRSPGVRKMACRSACISGQLWREEMIFPAAD